MNILKKIQLESCLAGICDGQSSKYCDMNEDEIAEDIVNSMSKPSSEEFIKKIVEYTVEHCADSTYLDHDYDDKAIVEDLTKDLIKLLSEDKL